MTIRFFQIFALFFLCSAGSKAQDFSNKGKDFYLCFPQHVPSGNTLAKLSIWITSDKASAGTITMANGAFSSSFSIAANGLAEIQVPFTAAHISNGESSNEALTQILKKSIRVKVNSGQPPVVAYLQQFGAARSAATLLLPVAVLGRQYHVISFTQNGSNNGSYGARSQFQVIATKPNTVVQITPTKNGVQSAPFTITLPLEGDMFQYQPTGAGASTQDLTGTYIESIASGTGTCNPIAVFSGSSNVTFNTNTCSGGNSYDPLLQQLYPVSSWGKNFGFVPFSGYPNGNPFRIMAAEDNTTIQINGVNVATINKGQIYPSTFTTTPIVIINASSITADKPICVAQYMQAAACSGNSTSSNQGDPDMVVLSPIEQNISDITIFSTKQEVINSQYINVLLKTIAVPSFRISRNGCVLSPPLSAWQPLPSLPGYSFLREPLSAPGTGTCPVGGNSDSYRLVADSGFNAIAYGLGNFESYAYNAGTNIRDFSQQISTSTQFGIETTPNVCSGTSFKFKISLPYQPDSLFLNFLGATNAPNAPFVDTWLYSPVFDSTTSVAGRTIYWYSFPLQYVYNNVGTYPTRITAYLPIQPGTCGTTQDIDFELEVSAPPVVNFTNSTSRCAAEPIQFTDATVSAKPTYLWYWNFGDPASGANNTSNVKTPSHLFSRSGTYNVKFSSITTAGCIGDTIIKQIVIAALPSGNVIGGLNVCINATQPVITFTGTGGSAPYTFTYNINGAANQTITTTGGASTATINAPTNTIGSFTYNLVNVQNAGSVLCTAAITGQSTTVVVSALPSAIISGNAIVCQNSVMPVINFTGSGANAPYTFTYNINGGATQTISSVGSSSTISLNAPTGTAGTFVYNLLSVAENSATACIINLSPTPNVSITVNSLPTATVSAGTNVCRNATAPIVTFTGANGTAPYSFNYTINGAAQPVLVSTGNTATLNVPTNTAGTFNYQLLSVKDASSTACTQIQIGSASFTVFPTPTATIGSNVTTLCGAFTIDFNGSASTAGAGTISSYAWNFGDAASGTNNTTSVANPTHKFSATGTYTVTLIVTTSNGCVSQSASTDVKIDAKPKAGFVLPEVCLLDPFAQFTDTSSVAAPSTITGWMWNFGDPSSGGLNTSTIRNAQHKYNLVGNYNVQLIVTTSNGCRDTLTQQLTINSGDPMSNFVQQLPGMNCANDSVGIISQSTITSGSITKIEIYWDNTAAPTVFDLDNFPTPGKIYRHKYPNFQSPLTKVFSVRMRAYSGGVCFSDKIVMVTVNASPKVQFSALPNTCYVQAPFQITQASEIGGVPGNGVFSGPGISASGMINPTGQALGVPLTIKYVFTSNAAGCKDSASQTITILDTAQAKFSVSAPRCERTLISFTDQSVAVAGTTITSTTWNFGDGSANQIFTSGSPITHSYNVFGNYTVVMFATNSQGCRSTNTSQTIAVTPIPKPLFSFDKTDYCVPNAVVIFNSSGSSIADGTQSTFTYAWDFGDPASGTLNTSTAVNPSHTYSVAGTYPVKLTITSGSGCSKDTTIILDRLHPQPVANFIITKKDLCIGEALMVMDASTSADGTLTSWTWDFGEPGATSNSQNPPPYLYTKTGSYNIKLTVTNSLGCMKDTTKTVNVYNYPIVDAGANKFVLEGGSVTLEPTVTAVLPLYNWTWNVAVPNGYLNSSTVKNPISSPLTDVIYKLTVTGAGNCAASDTVSVKVLQAPRIPNTFSPNNDGINDFWVIKYLETYPKAKVKVFTRTGALVFSSIGYRKPWDGNSNGKTLPIDTYYYVIEPENGRATITGYVTILK